MSDQSKFFESQVKNDLADLAQSLGWAKEREVADGCFKIQYWRCPDGLVELTEGFLGDDRSLVLFQTKLVACPFTNLIKLLDEIKQ